MALSSLTRKISASICSASSKRSFFLEKALNEELSNVYSKQNALRRLGSARELSSSILTPKVEGIISAPETRVLTPSKLLKEQHAFAKRREQGKYEDIVQRVISMSNEEKGAIILAGDVFDVPIRKDIVHRVVCWQLAKRRQGTHCTKTISEVSGTGKKPWPQKGSGRARHGSLRGPQFRHGATMHGPKPRSYAYKLQKKVRRLGLKVALSARAAEGKLVILDELKTNSHKTKLVASYVNEFTRCKKFLIVDGGDICPKFKRATQNLHYVNVLPSIGLNVYSILQHDTLVMTVDAVNRIVERMHSPIKR